MIALAAALSDEILIGVTSDRFVESTRGKGGRSFGERKGGVVRYLEEIGALGRSRVVALDDAFGPALREEGLDSIFVTVDTAKNALRLNQARRQAGLHALEIVIVPKVLSEGGGFVSSTRIREGEIDCEGRLATRPHRSG